MKSLKITALLAAGTLLSVATVALAADKIDPGKREYESSCAACHGVKGKGDGSIAPEMKTKVPDLTVLAKKNGGVFPGARVYEVIDGRQDVKAHGWRDMPVWGSQYQLKGGSMYDDYPYDREAFVRGRILVLIDYLNRLQEK